MTNAMSLAPFSLSASMRREKPSLERCFPSMANSTTCDDGESAPTMAAPSRSRAASTPPARPGSTSAISRTSVFA